MLGLMVLGFFALYFGASFWLTRATWRWAKNNQRSKAWAYLVGFAMYNMVFWDWIPTLVTHEYLCSTQAGLKVYKTPEEWLKENPGLIVEINSDYIQWADKYLRDWKAENPTSRTDIIEDMLNKREVAYSDNKVNNEKYITIYNKRLLEETRRLQYFHAIAFESLLLVDRKNNDILVKETDFARGVSGNVFGVGGTPDELRQAIIFGFGNRTCSSGNINYAGQLYKHANNYIHIGE